MLRIDGEYLPVADLRALPLADLVERQPQIVEHGWMVGRAAQGQSVMDDRGRMLALLAQSVAQMERRFGVLRVEVERAPPCLACSGGVGRLEARAQQIPRGDIVGRDFEQPSKRGRGVLMAACVECDLGFAQQRTGPRRRVAASLERSVAVLVALAAAARTGAGARNGWECGHVVGLSSLCCSVIFPRRVEEVIETAAEAGHVEEWRSMAVGRKPGAKIGQPSR